MIRNNFKMFLYNKFKIISIRNINLIIVQYNYDPTIAVTILDPTQLTKQPYTHMFYTTFEVVIPDGMVIKSVVMSTASDAFHLAYLNGQLVEGTVC